MKEQAGLVIFRGYLDLRQPQKKFPGGNLFMSDAEIVLLHERCAKLTNQIRLLVVFLLHFPGESNFVDNFRVAGGFFDARLDEVLQELL